MPCSLASPAEERAGFDLSGANSPSRAPRGSRFPCGIAERESRSFLVLLIQTCDPLHTLGKAAHAEKAAAGFSRCQQPLLPQCHEGTLYLCTGTCAGAVPLGCFPHPQWHLGADSGH